MPSPNTKKNNGNKGNNKGNNNTKRAKKPSKKEEAAAAFAAAKARKNLEKSGKAAAAAASKNTRTVNEKRANTANRFAYEKKLAKRAAKASYVPEGYRRHRAAEEGLAAAVERNAGRGLK